MTGPDDVVTGLLDRDAELAAVEQALASAVSGRGALLLVEGEAGIGKTRLLRAAAALAVERGLRVLSARGGELERELAFGVVRQLLEPPAAARPELLSGAAALAEPALRAGGAEAEDAPAPFAVLHGLYWLTANLATGAALLLVVDDAHWSDEPSLRYLDSLARRLDGLPVALLVATRPNAGGTERGLWGVLAAEPLAELVRPRPLGEAAVATLVRRELGRPPEPAFVRACHEATGG
ncbi:AAA family ATPase, partial [Pseudonocardia nigra]|uniref:AAA family ATPase n=1 Tax=Pseudonocardia nigra TaxID=1921578 RepID=UPI001C5EAED0